MNVWLPPAQIVALAGLIVQLGDELTARVALHVVVQPLLSVTVTV